MPRSLHSEEIQEIMGRIPGWVVRWGISVIFSLFAVLLLISFFFKYPETIASSIVITTSNPPSDLIARSTGKIEYLLVENQQEIKKDDIIAVLFNTADYRSVLKLEKLLTDSVESTQSGATILTEDMGQLGELQSYYSALKKSIQAYTHYMQMQAIPLQKRHIENQIVMLKKSIATRNEQLNILQKDKNYELENLKRDSVLYQAQALTEAEYEATQQKLLQKELSVTSQQDALISAQNEILSLEKQLTDLTIQYDNELNDFQLQFDEQKNLLLAQIKLWKDSYILCAPNDGKVTFTKYWSVNQNITTGDRLATLVPQDSLHIIGRMIVPSAGFAKVKIGQQVNVKLSGFPYMEYGLLKGRLASLSSVPEVDESGTEGYIAEVIFPDGLISSYKNRFRFIQQMDGTAEIITKDTRLIERFLQPLKSLFENH